MPFAVVGCLKPVDINICDDQPRRLSARPIDLALQLGEPGPALPCARERIDGGGVELGSRISAVLSRQVAVAGGALAI